MLNSPDQINYLNKAFKLLKENNVRLMEKSLSYDIDIDRIKCLAYFENTPTKVYFIRPKKEKKTIITRNIYFSGSLPIQLLTESEKLTLNLLSLNSGEPTTYIFYKGWRSIPRNLRNQLYGGLEFVFDSKKGIYQLKR